MSCHNLTEIQNAQREAAQALGRLERLQRKRSHTSNADWPASVTAAINYLATFGASRSSDYDHPRALAAAIAGGITAHVTDPDYESADWIAAEDPDTRGNP